MRLKGKNAIVTGAGSGIGLAIAERFAAEGARVALLDIRLDTAEQAAANLSGEGHVAIQADVSDSASVSAAFAAYDEQVGRVDLMINNAGVDRTPGDGFDEMMKGELQLLNMSDDAFRMMMAINVEGVFYCMRESVRLMKRDGVAGSIVNMSSIAGLAGQGTLHYATSKAALLGMTRSAARSLGGLGIRVNAVCPGVIDTPMTRGVPDAALKGVMAGTPLQRMGMPEDIAQAVLYLSSEESSFVTGQWLSPNGGLVTC
ncbi:MAG: SDR family NAD(P)-dependent oxidoreductase [Myxococcota bacterium]